MDYDRLLKVAQLFSKKAQEAQEDIYEPKSKVSPFQLEEHKPSGPLGVDFPKKETDIYERDTKKGLTSPEVIINGLVSSKQRIQNIFNFFGQKYPQILQHQKQIFSLLDRLDEMRNSPDLMKMYGYANELRYPLENIQKHLQRGPEDYKKVNADPFYLNYITNAAKQLVKAIEDKNTDVDVRNTDISRLKTTL